MTTTTYYKAVRLDGTDFYTGTVPWAPPEGHDGEWVVTHPDGVRSYAGADDEMEEVLCASTEPADCTGFKWPCRLLLVEPTEDSGLHAYGKNKVRGTRFRVIGERPAHEALGPNGKQAAAFIALCETLPEAVQAVAPMTVLRWEAWVDARDAAGEAARASDRVAAWVAAQSVVGAAGNTAWGAAWDGALAYVVRDLIPTETFEILASPFREAGIDLP